MAQPLQATEAGASAQMGRGVGATPILNCLAQSHMLLFLFSADQNWTHPRGPGPQGNGPPPTRSGTAPKTSPLLGLWAHVGTG